MSPLTNNRKPTPERAILVGVYRGSSMRVRETESLDELKSLADTAGAEVVRVMMSELKEINPATFIGSGKAAEISETVRELSADVVIFDEDLSPAQNRNLEEALAVKVVDRTGLILDIFARRARTNEGKLQVELAQLSYLLPRLAGTREFSRLAGGIGTRGPGETKLEDDRRRAREKVSRLKKELKDLRSRRQIHRTKRQGIPMSVVSIVGYTNAGKSTLMRALTGADVLIEDKLFATLDPTVRRIKLKSGREILVADTVGFVRKLPHQLVEAFHATFEEVQEADVILHVIDISHPQMADQINVVETVLKELGLEKKPVIKVYNKMDIVPGIPSPLGGEGKGEGDVFISALKDWGLKELLVKLDDRLCIGWKNVTLLLPYAKGAALSEIFRTCRVKSQRHLKGGVKIDVEMNEKFLNKYKNYLI